MSACLILLCVRHMLLLVEIEVTLCLCDINCEAEALVSGCLLANMVSLVSENGQIK